MTATRRDRERGFCPYLNRSILLLFLLYQLTTSILKHAVDITDPPFFQRTVRSRPTYLQHRERTRILFLSHHYEYTTFLDRSFYHQYEAAKRHPFVEAVLWGPGIQQWDNSKSIEDNIVQRYGRFDYFDIVFLFGHCRNDQLYALGQRGVMVTHREFECFDSRCGWLIEMNNPAIFQLSYMVDMRFYVEHSKKRVVLHSPHGADPYLFYQPATAYRSVDVYLAGAINTVYPLRQRWFALKESGRLRIHHRQHPPYFAGAFQEDPHWSHEDYRQVQEREAQVQDYARELKGSKIFLTDSSVYRYMLMKYVEATMAGCLIIGDLPDDVPDLFRRIVVPVDHRDSDDRLVAVVQYWLENESERIRRVQEAQQLILPEFSWDTSIDRLIEGANAYREGRYGMYYSGSFIQSCAATNALDGKMENEWCQNR